MPRKATPKQDTIVPSEQLVRPALAWLDADPSIDITEIPVATEGEIEAPGIPASVKSGRILLPSIMMTKQFHELQDNVDAIEKRLDFFAQQHNIGGYIEDSVPTGCLSYDFAMGGGLPIGKFISNAGPEQSGKSTLFNTLVPWFVNSNIPVYWFDPESARDPTYAERIFNRFDMSLLDIQGRRSKDGKHWDILPMVRYTNHHIGEDIFNAIAGILLALPEIKQDPNGQWWERVPEGQWAESAAAGAPQYLFLIDSFPAMLPELVQESLQEKGDKSGAIGIQARMFSDNLKKVKAALTSRRCTLLGNNQIRMKPMAMGCLHSDVKIPFVDGRSFTMREIVEQRITGQVWSLNETTGTLEPKSIVSWHNNGVVNSPDDWVSIKTAAIDTPNGVAGVTVTPNHEIFANGTWVPAEDIKVGDLVRTQYLSQFNGTLLELFAGMSVGDIALQQDARSSNGFFRLADSENDKYLQWKMSLLSPYFSFRRIDSCGRVSYVSNSTYELGCWVKASKQSGHTRSALHVASRMTALSLAVWYMDDGNLALRSSGSYRITISAKRFRNCPDELAALSSVFARYGIEHVVRHGGSFVITAAAVYKFFDLIVSYVPACMWYKLPAAYQGRFHDYVLSSTPEYTHVDVPVLSITRGSARMFRLRTKYDITVEDNHNYMAGNPCNGFIVHNSPEVEPGGEALKFYTDARFQVRRVSPSTAGAKRTEGGATYNEEPSINGGTDKYTYSKLKNTKNKMYTPYREGAIRIRMEHEGHPGDGIDQTYDVLQYLDATGQLLKASNGKYKLEVRGVAPDAPKPSIFGTNFVDSAMPYMTLKNIIEAPENKQGLWKHCLRQIRSGFAFEIEQEMIDRAEGRLPEPVLDDSNIVEAG